MRVLIVGGGITGLALANLLKSSAHCLVVEAEPRLGGKILTDRDDGFVVEAGPDSFLAAKPAAEQLCRSLGLEADLIDTLPQHNHTFVVRGGRLHELPAGLVGFIPTRWAPFARTGLLSLGSKLRMGCDYFLPRRPGDGDESMADFFTRRLGGEAFKWLVEPLLAGIYAGDGRQLSLQSTFPRFVAMEREHGGLLRASLAAARQPAGAASSMFRTLRGGLGDLVAALERELDRGGVELSRQTAVVGLEASGKARLSNGQTWEGDAVALCVPAFVAANLLAPLRAPLADLLRDIPYASSATVSLAFPEAAIGTPQGYGFVVPRAEERPLLACTWTSSKWPHRAPAGSVLVRCYVGGSGRDKVLGQSDEQLVTTTQGELQTLLGMVGRAHPILGAALERSLPQYLVGHAARIAAIDDQLKSLPRIVLAGAAYRGPGLPDCISDAERAAAKIQSLVG